MEKVRLALALLLTFFSLATLPVDAQDPMPLGMELQVNDYTTTGSHSDPRVLRLASGDFVTVWHSYGSPGTDDDQGSIQMRRFRSDGSPVSGQVQVNSHTTGSQRHAVAAPMADGGFLVVWDSGSPTSVRSQRFDSSGIPMGQEEEISSGVEPGIGAAPGGEYVIVWEDFSVDFDGDVSGQRFSSTGTAIGAEFIANTYTTGFQPRPTVSMSQAGDFLVTWFSDGSLGDDSSSFSIQGRRFDSSANPVGDQFQINSTTADGQYYPFAASDDDGGFLVVWTKLWVHGNGGVRGRRLLSDGSFAGPDFLINDDESVLALRTSIDRRADGFVVAWGSAESAGSDTSSYSTQARLLGSDGTPLGEPFQVNTYTTGGQGWQGTSVAEDGVGGFVVAWRNDDGYGSPPTSIQAQVYGLSPLFVDGFESGDVGAWSASLP